MKTKECPLSFIKIIQKEIKSHGESLCVRKMLHLLGNNLNLALLLLFSTFICGTQMTSMGYYLEFYKELIEKQIYTSIRSTGLTK